MVGIATKWHKRTQNQIGSELTEKGFTVDIEKVIGLSWPATRENQIKMVDILGEKEDEIIIVEIEDLVSGNKEHGVSFTELAGILLLAYLSTKNLGKKASLWLIFNEDIDRKRLGKIEAIVKSYRDSLKPLNVEILTRP